MINFTRILDNKSTTFNQLDHKYKFLYKDQILWSILDAFESKLKHVYRYKILDGDNIKMTVNNSLDKKLIDGYIYGYDNVKNQIIKIKSRKLEDSVFVDMNEQLTTFELIFYKGDKILFTDNFYNHVVRKDELTKSVYIFTDQLYKIIRYKDATDVIQLTCFKSLVEKLNVKKIERGKMVDTFTIRRNSKLIGDFITTISTEDYALIEKCDLELSIEIY